MAFLARGHANDNNGGHDYLAVNTPNSPYRTTGNDGASDHNDLNNGNTSRNSSYAPLNQRSQSFSQPQEKHPMLQEGRALSKSSARSPLLLSAWIFEIVCLLFSFAILTAVCVILSKYDRRLNPTWKGGVTLNTILSFGSMFFRMSLLIPVASCISQLSWVWLAKGERPLFDVVRFDDASRGPLGSLKLLFSHHVSTVAFLGALVSVGSLVIGPFFQQSIVFYNDDVISKIESAYASFAPEYSFGLGDNPVWKYDVTPFNLKRAAFAGFYSNGGVQPLTPPFICPSGNCTWDPFATLAVGVHCRDAPEQYELKPWRSPFNATFDQDRDPPRYAMVSSDNPTNNTHIIIQGMEIDPTIMHFATAQPLLNEDAQNYFQLNIEWIRALDLIEDTTSMQPLTYVAANSTIDSAQCTLYVCVQEVSAKVHNGQYSEEVLREIEPTREQNVRVGRKNSSAWTYKYQHGDGSERTFAVLLDDVVDLYNNLVEPFQTNTTYQGLQGEFDHKKLLEIQRGNFSMLPFQLGIDAPKLLEMLYSAPNITDMIKSLALHTNIALRSLQSLQDKAADPRNLTGLPENYIAPKHQVSGNILVNQIHVEVRWPWLILPGILSMIVLVLLVLTIFLSKRAQVGLWKGSPIAMMLYGQWGEQKSPAMRYARTEKELKMVAQEFTAASTIRTDSSSGVERVVAVERKNRSHIDS